MYNGRPPPAAAPSDLRGGTPGPGTPSFASLVNRRLVFPSNDGAHFMIIDRKFLIECLAPAIARIPVDEAFYRARHPDVARGIDDRAIGSVEDHYRLHGYFEHRMPWRITVNQDWYRQQYADVSDAIDRKIFASAQVHFEENGFKEGRLPFPQFDLTRPPYTFDGATGVRPEPARARTPA